MSDIDTATRAQALTLKVNGFTHTQIEQQTGVPASILDDLYDLAISRGFDPKASKTVLNRYVELTPMPTASRAGTSTPGPRQARSLSTAGEKKRRTSSVKPVEPVERPESPKDQAEPQKLLCKEEMEAKRSEMNINRFLE